MTPLLAAEGIVVASGRTPVLRGVAVSVGAGEVVGIFGPNGSGKTTLVDVVSGHRTPGAGRVLFDGRDVTRLPMDERFRLGLARTFQVPLPYPTLTVLESVRVAFLGGRVRSGGEEESGGVGDVLRRTGLYGQRHWPAARLSQGCLRRLELARAISCGPRLLVLDEIFSALSPRDEADLVGLVRALNRDDGVAVLLVSHDARLIEEMCGRVEVLEDGRIVREWIPGGGAAAPAGEGPAP